MTDLTLKCRCGEVIGCAKNVSPSSGNRVICCCSDCQAFARFLNREDDMLDDCGGTEIFQMPQSQLTIQQGHDKLQSMRLTENGLLRWYTSCCNTPVGNTVNAKMPFVGVIHTFINSADRDTVLGPVKAVIQTQYAKGEPDYPRHSANFPLSVTLRLVGQLLLWKLQGKQKPSVFFGDDGRPMAEPIIASE